MDRCLGENGKGELTPLHHCLVPTVTRFETYEVKNFISLMPQILPLQPLNFLQRLRQIFS